MKKIYVSVLFCLCASILLLLSCGNPVQKVTLKGNFVDLDKDTLYLVTENNSSSGVDSDETSLHLYIIDTIVLEKGKFTLQKNLKEPAYYQLFLLKNKVPYPLSTFFLSEGETVIEKKDSSLEVNGQKEQQSYTQYIKGIASLLKKRDSLNLAANALLVDYSQKIRQYKKRPQREQKKWKEAVEKNWNALDKQKTHVLEEEKKRDSVFIVDHKDAYVSAWLVSKKFKEQLQNRNFNEKSFKKFVAGLDRKIQESEFIKNVEVFKKKIEKMDKEREERARHLVKGKPAPDFTLPASKGGTLALSSLKGKIIVLDFWASWCGPCREANPGLVKIYNKYKDKGVEFLGVSLDEKEEDWHKAIKEDKLTWLHVSDLKGWRNAAAKLYNVERIPVTFLVDKKGNFLESVSIRDGKLEKKLAELVK